MGSVNNKTVRGNSLEPLLKNEEEVKISKKFKTISKDELVVFEHMNKEIVKIVKGVPSDTFTISSENKLFINDKYECDVLEKCLLRDFSECFNGILPEDNYIVLGTTMESIDSRTFGPILRKSIIGKIIK